MLFNSQDIRIGCPTIHMWGELGVQFLFIPLHYTQKIWRYFGHQDTPLAKGLSGSQQNIVEFVVMPFWFSADNKYVILSENILVICIMQLS